MADEKRKRPRGRPIAASEAQRTRVLELHASGASLRRIAKETALGVNTVRTIVDKESGKDRTTRKHHLEEGRAALLRPLVERRLDCVFEDPTKDKRQQHDEVLGFLATVSPRHANKLGDLAHDFGQLFELLLRLEAGL